MLQYLDTYVGLQEIPGEVSLVIIFQIMSFSVEVRRLKCIKAKRASH